MFGLLAWSLSAIAPAQSNSVADLELAITPPLAETLRPGSVGTLEIVITNHGPDTAGVNPTGPVIIASSDYLESMAGIGGRAVYFGGIDAPDSCEVHSSHIDPPPPQGPLYSSFIRFGPVPAGMTHSCRLQYALNPQLANTIIEVGWEVGSPVDSDPKPGNNAVGLVFTIGAEPAAVPVLSAAGTWMAACLFLLVALATRFRQLNAQVADSSGCRRENVPLHALSGKHPRKAALLRHFRSKNGGFRA